MSVVPESLCVRKKEKYKSNPEGLSRGWCDGLCYFGGISMMGQAVKIFFF